MPARAFFPIVPARLLVGHSTKPAGVNYRGEQLANQFQSRTWINEESAVEDRASVARVPSWLSQKYSLCREAPAFRV